MIIPELCEGSQFTVFARYAIFMPPNRIPEEFGELIGVFGKQLILKLRMNATTFAPIPWHPNQNMSQCVNDHMSHRFYVSYRKNYSAILRRQPNKDIPITSSYMGFHKPDENCSFEFWERKSRFYGRVQQRWRKMGLCVTRLTCHSIPIPVPTKVWT